MGVFDRVLRSGEGKKVRALASLVPDVNALEPEMKALSDDALRAKTGEPQRGQKARPAKVRDSPAIATASQLHWSAS